MNKKMRVWWIPNPPREAFYMNVKSEAEAKKVLNTLAEYDLYLGDSVIHSNAGGLEVFEDGEWCEYIDEFGDEFEF